LKGTYRLAHRIIVDAFEHLFRFGDQALPSYPSQYDGKHPIAIAVSQEWASSVGREGEFRVPVVLDNLLATNELLSMMAEFVVRGDSRHGFQHEKPPNGFSRARETCDKSIRSTEYGTLITDYAHFLVEEVPPQLHQYARNSDSTDRKVGVLSSGATCAFTLLWQSPEAIPKGIFQGVFFLDEGLDQSLPEWGRGTERHRDLIAALKYKGYDYRLTFGEGTNKAQQATSIVLESMRWLLHEDPR
jgi:enterochelin esterase family protein